MFSKIKFLFLAGTITAFFACNQAIHKHCCDTSSQSFISDSVKVFVPTIFTPNGDGVNDIFTYFTNNEKAFSLHRLIVSKGNIVAFDKQDSAIIRWDGLIDGKKAKENVLNYRILLRRANATTADSIVDIRGTVCLRNQAPICTDEVTNCSFPDQFNSVNGVVSATTEPLLETCK